MNGAWLTRNLSQVAAINYGYTESAAADPVGPKFLRITDIQNGAVDWSGVPYCKIDEKEADRFKLASGDIVFARTGATTGKSFLIREPPDSVFASYLIRLRLLSEDLLPEFVSLFFQTDTYWKSITDGSSGSAQGGFNARKLGDLSIPVPSRDEQHRIVSVLDEAFASIGIARSNAEKNLQNARELFEASRRDLWLKATRGYKSKRLGDIAEVQSGGTPRVTTREFWGGEIPWYSSGELNTLTTEAPARFVTAAGLDQSNAKLFPTGSLLIGMYDTAALKMSILDRDAAFNQAVAGVRPNETINLEFVLHSINVEKARLLMQRRGVRQKNLSLEKIKDIAIPFPAKDLQEQLVCKLRDHWKESLRLESIYRRKLAALDELKQSLLHQAFSGVL